MRIVVVKIEIPFFDLLYEEGIVWLSRKLLNRGAIGIDFHQGFSGVMTEHIACIAKAA